MIIIENVSRALAELAAQGVTMVTEIERDHIAYAIWLGHSPTAGDRSNASKVWQRIVYFGATDATVAGGAAFREAAREQEHDAQVYAQAAMAA